MPNGSLRDTAVVVLHWGRPEVLRVMLERLRQTYPDQGEPRVILVENGPPPVAVEEFAVDVVRLPRNLGYGVANNRGIRAALAGGANFVVLLNNDVGVSSGIFEAMRAKADGPARSAAHGDAGRQNVGLVGAVLQETDGLVYGGGRISWLRLRANLARDQGGRLHYIHGACLGVTRACLEAVGMFREDFFLYWEDVDYGLRARRAGFEFAVVEHPVLLHAASSSLGADSPAKIYYLVRNAVHLVAASGSLPARLWAKLTLPARRQLAERRGKIAVARALQDAARGITGPAPEDL